jgi:hypothetical protein
MLKRAEAAGEAKEKVCASVLLSQSLTLHSAIQ